MLWAMPRGLAGRVFMTFTCLPQGEVMKTNSKVGPKERLIAYSAICAVQLTAQSQAAPDLQIGVTADALANSMPGLGMIVESRGTLAAGKMAS